MSSAKKGVVIAHPANASKLIEKCFLDLRNISLNQENVGEFCEDLSRQEKFSRPFHKFILISKNGLKIRIILLKQ